MAFESGMKREKAGEYASDKIFPQKTMQNKITKELMKEETPKTPGIRIWIQDCSGVELNELKNLLTGGKYLIMI